VSRRSPYIITLTEEERQELALRAKQYSLPHRVVVRAKIILMAADGLNNDVIASKVGVPRQIVSKWRKRFYEQRMDGLRDLPRGPVPRRRPGPPAPA